MATLSSAQLTTLRSTIEGDPTALAIAQNGNTIELAGYYNTLASPDFWTWRTNVSRADVYHATSPDATTWNWTTFKNQSVTEQNAWIQMFMGDLANFALANLRAGVAAIFTGSQAQTDQRNHCLAVGRRKATRLEKLFATGTGSSGDPAVMAVEGSLTTANVVALGPFV
jgi:hypothetical protein